MTGLTQERVAADRTPFGPALETFVVAEILRLATWSDVVPTMYHYRDKDQDEVDIVLEDDSGRIVGVEVKASATGDFRGLRKVMAAACESLRLGLVLYDGDSVVRFGDRLVAAPVSSLWSD